jgi:hypothetical protein
MAHRLQALHQIEVAKAKIIYWHLSFEDNYTPYAWSRLVVELKFHEALQTENTWANASWTWQHMKKEQEEQEPPSYVFT